MRAKQTRDFATGYEEPRVSPAPSPVETMGHSEDERRLNVLSPSSLPAEATSSTPLTTEAALHILDRVSGEDERQRRERLTASVRITKTDLYAALAASRAGDRSLILELQRRHKMPLGLLLAPRCTAFLKPFGRPCRNVAVRGKDLCSHHLWSAEMAAESRNIDLERENP